MGLQHSKLVINSTEGAKVKSGDEIQRNIEYTAEKDGVEAVLKTTGEVDEIPSADGVSIVDENDRSKCTTKPKPNIMARIQKMISLKKKSSIVEPEASATPETAVETSKEKTKISCIETQSDKIVKIDQGAGQTDTIGSEPIVEIVPETTGLHEVGNEHFEETEHTVTEDIAEGEEKHMSAVGDLDLSENFDSLGTDGQAQDGL